MAKVDGTKWKVNKFAVYTERNNKAMITVVDVCKEKLEKLKSGEDILLCKIKYDDEKLIGIDNLGEFLVDVDV